MKAKKITTFSIVGASLAFILGAAVGCGNGGSKMPRPGDGTTAPLKIEVWNTFGHAQAPVFDQISQQFEDLILEHDGIDVDIESVYRSGYEDMASAIVKDFNNGRTPNIAVAYPDNVAKYIHNEQKPGDYIVDLDPLIAHPEYGMNKEQHLCMFTEKDILPTYMEEGTGYNRPGTLSLPFEKSTECLIYNKKYVRKFLLANEIGESEEKYMSDITWGEFWYMCDWLNTHREEINFVSEKNNEKYIIFYDSDANLFITQCFQRNVPYISLDEEGNGHIDFNNPGAREIVKEFNEMYQTELLCTGETENQYSSNYQALGRCLFQVGSTGGAGYNAPDSSGIDDLAVCKFPVYQNKVVAEDGSVTYTDIPEERHKFVSQGVTLTLFSNPALKNAYPDVNELKILYSWKFLKYLTNTENEVKMCLASNGYVPSRKSAHRDPKYQAFMNKPKNFLSKCADLVVNGIGDSLFNYPVFNGSSDVRNYMKTLMKTSLKEQNLTDAKLKQIFDDIENQIRVTIVG